MRESAMNGTGRTIGAALLLSVAAATGCAGEPVMAQLQTELDAAADALGPSVVSVVVSTGGGGVPESAASGSRDPATARRYAQSLEALATQQGAIDMIRMQQEFPGLVWDDQGNIVVFDGGRPASSRNWTFAVHSRSAAGDDPAREADPRAPQVQYESPQVQYLCVGDGISYRVRVGKEEREATLVGCDPRLGLTVLRVDPLPDGTRPVAAADGEVRPGTLAVWMLWTAEGRCVPTLATVTGTGATARIGSRVVDGAVSIDRGGNGFALVDAHGQVLGFAGAGEGGAGPFSMVTSVPLLEDVPMLGGLYRREEPGSSPRVQEQRAEAERDMEQVFVRLQQTIGSRRNPSAFLAGDAVAGDAEGRVIPLSRVRASVEQIVRTGEIRRAWLGLWLDEIADPVAQYLGIQGGAMVTGIVAGSPAEAAGLQSQDIITSIGGGEVRSVRDLREAVERRASGEEVEICVCRRGERLTLRATLGDAPDEEEASTGGRGASPVPEDPSEGR